MPKRIFQDKAIVLASHNAGKVGELAALLAPFGVAVRSAAELALPEPEETGDSFVANAELKATAAVAASGMAALADDSGIAIHALGGEPGIYSARWAGPGKDFPLAMARVNAELGDNPDRTAAFFCALSLAWPDGHVESFIGTVDGSVIWPPRGDNGFGYDAMFLPSGESRTFGEMSFAEKQPLTHRAHAFRQLTDACFSN
jgi:XTP/dITP diphosphohydrolase